jgi:Conserved TM helix
MSTFLAALGLPLAMPASPLLTPVLAQPLAQASFLSDGTIGSILPMVINLAGAIAILLIGWLVASIVAGVVRGLLKQTDFDNKVAGWVGSSARTEANIETWGGAIAFWLVMLLALVAALNVLNLTTVSQPINNFLSTILGYLPKIAGAAIFAGVAWVLATLVKGITIRSAQSLDLDAKLNPPTDADGLGETPFMLSETLGNVLYWFIFLIFLPFILEALGLQGTLQPVQALLNPILGAIPNILKAGVIAVAGWFVAKIVRGIVSNLLAALGADPLGAKFGLKAAQGRQSLSALTGTIVYVLILIAFAIPALEALQIPSISAPAQSMLTQVFVTLPRIATAILIMVLAYVVGKFLADLVTELLTGFGFNHLYSWLGLTAPAPAADTNTPSEIVGIITLVAALFTGAVAATSANVLGISELSAGVGSLTVIAGKVLSAVVVFAVGLYFANLAFKLISSTGGYNARPIAQATRIVIIVFVAAMALRQMEVAADIVNLAFGLLLGAIAVAIALAFGLGGRDVAAEQLREWLQSLKR